MNSFGRPISFGRPMFWIWFCSYQHELMLFSLQDVFEFWWTLNQHHLESIPGALFLKFLPKMQLDKGLFFNCSHVSRSFHIHNGIRSSISTYLQLSTTSGSSVHIFVKNGSWRSLYMSKELYRNFLQKETNEFLAKIESRKSYLRSCQAKWEIWRKKWCLPILFLLCLEKFKNLKDKKWKVWTDNVG